MDSLEESSITICIGNACKYITFSLEHEVQLFSLRMVVHSIMYKEEYQPTERKRDAGIEKGMQE